MLTSLGDLGKITLSTSGPPEPDHSLLNHPEFWDIATVQHAPGKPFSTATWGILQVVWLGDSQSFALFFSNVFLESIIHFISQILFWTLDSFNIWIPWQLKLSIKVGYRSMHEGEQFEHLMLEDESIMQCMAKHSTPNKCVVTVSCYIQT